ncbi:MAG: sigma-70 family RNA polymerase sigma factor [Bacteroidota bacterium]
MTAREFEHIYREHGKKLFRICLVFVKDEFRAAEMVQDIFCSIWERRETIELHGSWEHYLYRAAKFKYYNFYRDIVSEQRSLSTYATSQKEVVDNVEETVHYNQVLDKVQQLVEQLPPKRKEVYILSREKGLNSREISQKLHISEKTVKNQLTKSLAFLKVNLAPYDC